jgi:menaquinone-dependent protoporphyrinogen oxidase
MSAGVLIAYRSKYGTAAACARDLAGRIGAETRLVDLRRMRRIPIADFRVIIIGGSIYGGRIQREVTAFCDREREALLAKRVGLYICCLYRGEHAEAQLRDAFPEWLSAHAFSRAWLGGELHFRRLNPFDRLLVRGLVDKREDISLIRGDAVRELADTVNSILVRDGDTAS